MTTKSMTRSHRMTLLSDAEPGGPLNNTADTRLTASKRRYGRQARDILPGLFLTSIVAGAAFAIRQLPGMALFSPMILSIMIGIAYHNIVGKAAWAKQGVTFSLRRLLRIAII